MAFLFGDIFAISRADLRWIYLGGIVTLALEIWLWRPLLRHQPCTRSWLPPRGRAREYFKLLFVLLLALVVAIAIKIVGVLLTIAFLIMPAAAARPLSETPEQMAVFAAIFGMLSVALGLFLSVSLDTPGGPSIVSDAGASFSLPQPSRPVLRRASLRACADNQSRRRAGQRRRCR